MKELTQIGLTDAESLIYETVLKLGTCTVKDITKECGFHRTNIYDILEKLKEKGLITFYKESKATRYQVSDPQNLYEFLKEKTELLDTIFPQIEKLHKKSSEDIQVEVYKGQEGMKAVFRDMIREGSTIHGFGIRGQLREKMPLFAKQIIRELKNSGLKYYAIFTERGNLPSYYTKVKYVSKKLSGPVATFIYGNKININIWDPSLVAIVIKSPLVAKMYKQHFDCYPSLNQFQRLR